MDLTVKESHNTYFTVIEDLLYKMEVRELLLFIADGIPELDEEIKKLYPRADFQLYTVHVSRNFESNAMELDKEKVDKDLKNIFLSENKESALEKFNIFKNKWSSKYPRTVYNMEMKSDIFVYIFQLPSRNKNINTFFKYN